jgi:hypothetical protein
VTRLKVHRSSNGNVALMGVEEVVFWRNYATATRDRLDPASVIQELGIDSLHSVVLA